MEKMIRPSVLISEKAPKPTLNSFANFLSSHDKSFERCSSYVGQRNCNELVKT